MRLLRAHHRARAVDGAALACAQGSRALGKLALTYTYFQFAGEHDVFGRTLYDISAEARTFDEGLLSAPDIRVRLVGRRSGARLGHPSIGLLLFGGGLALVSGVACLVLWRQ